MTSSFDVSLLRVLFVTDGRGDEDRVVRQVRAVIDGGVRAIQVREPLLTARQLQELGERLRPVVADVGGLLMVNDRVDCAAAGAFDGAQVGHRSLRPAAARQVLSGQQVLGVSAHDHSELQAAVAARAEFALLSPIWPVRSKPNAVPLGVEVAGALTATAGLPVVWLGGVAADRAHELLALQPLHRPVGVAVMSGLALAPDPAFAASRLVAAFAAVLRPARG